MLNCISATILPNSGMKRPSTPASFMRRSTGSASRREREDVQEQPVRLRIVLQRGVDQPQRLA